MANDLGFSIEGWDDFVKNFAQFVDMWEEKKRILLQRMGNIYHASVIPHVPVDTSRLVDSIFVVEDGIPQDYVEVGTNVEYALYVNDGHVQHKRLLPVSMLSAGGKQKHYNTVEGKNGMRYVTLSERYVPGVHFMEKGFTDAKPRLAKEIESFMRECKREIEGGKM